MHLQRRKDLSLGCFSELSHRSYLKMVLQARLELSKLINGLDVAQDFKQQDECKIDITPPRQILGTSARVEKSHSHNVLVDSEYCLKTER